MRLRFLATLLLTSAITGTPLVGQLNGYSDVRSFTVVVQSENRTGYPSCPGNFDDRERPLHVVLVEKTTGANYCISALQFEDVKKKVYPHIGSTIQVDARVMEDNDPDNKVGIPLMLLVKVDDQKVKYKTGGGFGSFMKGVGSFGMDMATAYAAQQGTSDASSVQSPAAQSDVSDTPSQATQTNAYGNTCNVQIGMGTSEVQFDQSCGPSCSQIRIYPQVTVTEYTDHIRSTSFKVRVIYMDGTVIDEAGTSGGELLSGETTFKSRANIDRPHMILTVTNGLRVWRGAPVSRVQFDDVSCVVKERPQD